MAMIRKNVTVSAALNNTFSSYELDKNPELLGEIKVFLTYVGNNFKTPEVELNVCLKVYASLVVETDNI